MTVSAMLRGYRAVCVDNVWRWEDTGERVSEHTDRPCGHCGKDNTPEGHDGCLGTLPGVMNACCGHGDIGSAYVQFIDGRCIREHEATEWIKKRAVMP